MSTRAEEILDEATERAYTDVNLRQAPAAFLGRTVIAASGLPERLAAAETEIERLRGLLASACDLADQSDREKKRLRAALLTLKDSAWSFKMAVYATPYAMEGDLFSRWLERVSANLRVHTPDLQVGATHERLVAVVAEIDDLLAESTEGPS